MTRCTFEVFIDGYGGFECPADETVLRAMERAGGRQLAVGCRGGGCGVCKVRVTSGRYRTAPMSVSRVDRTERVTGFALACRLMPLSDLTLQPAWAPRRTGASRPE